MPNPPEVMEGERLVVAVILGCPHLVLTDVGDHQRFAVCGVPDIIDDVGGIKVPVIRQVLDIAHGALAAHLVDVRQPFAVIAGLQMWL